MFYNNILAQVLLNFVILFKYIGQLMIWVVSCNLRVIVVTLIICVPGDPILTIIITLCT